MHRLALALLLALPMTASAGDADEVGIPLVVQVVDATDTDKAVPTARVRNPEEKDAHPVNAQTGEWKGSVLYLPDGTERVFAKDMPLTFEITAPGYVPTKITYTMRKRKNKVQILLVPAGPMSVCPDDDPDCEDDVVTQFRRNKPVGGRPIEE